MEEKEQFAPTEIVKDGKVTRRTFVKGAGWLTITSAIGASALGCAPSKQGAEEEPLAETGPVADPEEGFTYKSACCSVNCHLALPPSRSRERRQDLHRHPRPDAWTRRLRQLLPALHRLGNAYSR